MSVNILTCDGKSCGQGKRAGGGKYVCPHNNLAILHPDIMQEWDYQKNTDLDPNKLLPGSHKKAYWKCNICAYEWGTFINNRKYHGCPKCAGNLRWTLARFLEHVQKKHGDRYDYSKITEEHIQGEKSKVPIRCNTCNYPWSPSIHDHVQGTVCPNCAGRVRWSLARFLKQAKEVHGDCYDYSGINKAHIQGQNSKVLIQCKKCNYQWTPKCAGNLRWTLARFLERVQEVHKDRYDYSKITEEHIQGEQSRIQIRCNTCNYPWSPSIHNHVQGAGCPNCAGIIPWTLARFLKQAKEVHGDCYDYSGINKAHIQGSKSKVLIKCNTCNYSWTPTITNHIRGYKCPNCAGRAPWTLARFLERAKEVHGDCYDYSGITEKHIQVKYQ
jgi:Zn finger protein HypA/HybF involved in hydrogenase expression